MISYSEYKNYSTQKVQQLVTSQLLIKNEMIIARVIVMINLMNIY